MTAQAGKVYRYFRIDADHDISADTLELSTDEVTWFSAGVVYVAPDDLPPSCIAANTRTPPDAGYTGYWWRVLTGPSTSLPFIRGTNNVYARLTDTPEIPHFKWKVYVRDAA